MRVLGTTLSGVPGHTTASQDHDTSQHLYVYLSSSLLLVLRGLPPLVGRGVGIQIGVTRWFVMMHWSRLTIFTSITYGPV